MIDEKFRKALREYADEMGWGGDEPQPVIFDNASYDGSVVGITESGSVVYDYDSMVEEYMADNGCTYEEAVEWIDYNTIRALPYASSVGIAPTILGMSKKGLLERYGD